ncbi:hypothetical protein [Novosphingobium aquae]|uniref:Uncharacterized protein n=1 Tax=Novosphingobium aquae TaxID=3133435 RepID=A0ABU8SC30_9SPHN
MINVTTRKLRIFAPVAYTCLALPALADAQFDDLKNQTEGITNLVDAENTKSALCKSYVGKRVVPTTFNALATILPKRTVKGEFETTAQYQAKIASTPNHDPANLSVLVVPIDRTFVRYDADIGIMLVSAGALNTGEYSEQTGAEASALLAVGTNASKGTPVFVGQSERIIRTYAAHNLFGAAFRVSEIDRTTQALHLTNTRLFPFAKRETSPVMGFEVPLAAAPSAKQSLRTALVVRPQAPFFLSYNFKGPEPTASKPNGYIDRTSILVAEAQCALVLSAQNQVLASVDTSTPK